MRCQSSIGSPEMLRHVGRYPLQPLLCLGDGTCPQQLVKEWHHSGAVPCLLLHPLGLQRAKAAEGHVSLLRSPVRQFVQFKGDVWLRWGKRRCTICGWVGERCAPL